jgi:RpiR family carbohydrate utilization transcriptional regulator
MENEIGIIMKMNSVYESLSKSEKKVVSYIIGHPHEVIRLSVTELADKSGASEATVVRTCRKLGMTGYQDLKVCLAQSLVSPIQAINESIKEDDSYAEMIRKVFNSTIHTLKYTMSVLNFNSVKEAAELIDDAERIVIVALGNSASLALDLYHKLLRLGFNPVVCSDTHMQMIISCGSTAGSVMIAISHSGSSKDVVEAAKLWKNGGGKLITLTNIGHTPLSKLSDVALVTASRETMYKLSALSSRAAQMVIIDSVYTLIAMEHRDKISERFVQIDECLKKKKY